MDIFDIVVKNNEGYDKELQYYQSYAYTIIPKKSAKTIRGANEGAVKFYESCGFEVEVKTRKVESLNEVPKIEPKKKELQNLNEVGVKKDLDIQKEEKISTLNEGLEQKLESLDVDKLRALLSSVGVNPRRLMDKEKLMDLAMEQDEELLLSILNFKG